MESQKGEWNKIGRDKEMEGSGYCTHSMPSFPTWHRSYLAMIEVSYHSHSLLLIESYHRSNLYIGE